MAEEHTATHGGATPVRGSDVIQLVRMSLRPPTRFGADADYTLSCTDITRQIIQDRYYKTIHTGFIVQFVTSSLHM